MRLHIDCVPCLQRQALQATRLITEDEKIQEQILRKILEVLLESDWKTPTTEMAMKTHQIIKKITGNSDPYSVPKIKYNQLALKLYPEMKQLVQQSERPFLTALKLSIAGNIIDFGALKSFDIKETIKRVLGSRLTVDSSDILHRSVKTASSLIYLADNTGEIVFDKIFIETILYINPKVKITLVVKKKPFINDAMLTDAFDVGLNSIPNIEFHEIGSNRCDPDFISYLKKFDVIISKGQANFEDFSTFKNIFFLFIVKCAIVANELDVPEGSTIVKIS